MIRTSRGSVLAIVTTIAMAMTPIFAGGCPGPYENIKAESVKKPAKKARPPEAAPVAEEIKYDEDCKTKFQEDNTKVRRKSPQQQIDAGDQALQLVDQTPDPAQKANAAIEAINKYKNALAQDPYSALATYKLAVSYALVRKKGCAIALLKRLTELQKHPDFENEATRMIKSVDDEPAFKGFHKDALTAAGL